MPIPRGDQGSGENPLAGVEDELSRQIVEAENSSAWTLMHRFNKAADLMDMALSVGSPIHLFHFHCASFLVI